MAAGTVERSVTHADELREALDHALAELDRDERFGPALRASGLAIRLRLTDVDLSVRVEACQESEHHLQWSFDDDAPAKLELAMDSATANAYLQGEESLAIAIARGRVHCRGESRLALFYLPVLKLLCDPYRR